MGDACDCHSFIHNCDEREGCKIRKRLSEETNQSVSGKDIKYKAHLSIHFLTKDTFEADTFEELQNGFWISKYLNVTSSSEGVLWVPPHKIEYIKKIEGSDNE